MGVSLRGVSLFVSRIHFPSFVFFLLKYLGKKPKPPPLTTPIHNTGVFFSKVRVRAYKALEPYCARQCANIANYPEADPGGGPSGGSIEPPF